MSEEPNALRSGSSCATSSPPSWRRKIRDELVTRAFSAWILFVAALAAVAAVMPSISAVPLAAAVGVAVWRWPAAALGSTAFAVLAVRPALDMFSERRFGLSEFAVSPAVVFGLGVLLVAVVLAFVRARSGRTVWPDRSLRRAHL